MAQSLTIADTPLAGVKIIRSHPHTDERGAFSRWFCWRSLKDFLPADQCIRQINHSLNLRAGTVRGMHMQRLLDSCAQTTGEYKFVRAMSGRVYDVVLDLRHNSETFGEHIAVELSEDNHAMLLIPPGCAHGFQALEDNTQLLYLHTQDYQAELDMGVQVTDPQFKINWPLAIENLSARDQSFALFSQLAESGQL